MNVKSDRLTRRGVLGATVGGAVAIHSIKALAQARQKTFILVHGAWHGGWCWGRVAARLSQAGHRVLTPTNTGLGERSHLLSKDINITTHVLDIVNMFKWEDLSDVVLVGHSYGGYVISGVADRVSDRIASIIFLDAYMPADGESLASRSLYPDSIAAAVKRGDIALPAPPASSFGITDRADAAWADAKFTPHPFGTYLEHVSYKGGRERIAKKAYIRAKAHPNPNFDESFAITKSNPDWKTHEFACGHDVMLIEPAQLTSTIEELS